jgi:hypothetical protein
MDSGIGLPDHRLLGPIVMIYLLVFGCAALLLSGQAAAQTYAGASSAKCLGAYFGEELPKPNDEEARVAFQEAVCLGELASRKGDELTLRIENGKPKTYRTNRKACDDDAARCVLYWLVSYHAAARVYSIRIHYYEGRGFELVSARSGKVLRLSGVPYFSKDGSRFVVIDSNEAYGGPYDLAVGSITKDSLSVVWERPHTGGPYLEWHFQNWIDNDHIALRSNPLRGAMSVQ